MIRLLLSEVNPGTAEAIASELTDDGQIVVVGFARDGLEAAQMVAQLKPDVALIHASLPGMDGFSAVQMASLAHPETACVILVDGQPGAHEKAMRAGARAVVNQNADAATLRRLIEELGDLAQIKSEPEYNIITDPTKMPVTIAVTGAKGGIGKTTTTINLALCLVKRFPGQVVLVDFFGQFGDVSLHLDLNSAGSIADLSSYSEIDQELVEQHLGTHPSGLKVLAAPSGRYDLTKKARMDVSYLADLLGMLRRKYRFVIFDIPPLMGDASEYVFSRCTFIVVVTALTDIAAIRDTGELLGVLESQQIAKDRIKLVANQDGATKQFTVRDLEEATGHRVVHRIPYDSAAVVRAVNEGIPICVSQANSAIGRSYDELADLLLKDLPG